jgi:hypothetical protein
VCEHLKSVLEEIDRNAKGSGGSKVLGVCTPCHTASSSSLLLSIQVLRGP